MRLLHVTHPSGFRHDTGVFHPERPARLRAANLGVARSDAEVLAVEASPVDMEDLWRVHQPDYVEAIRRFCASGGGHLDADTVASDDSWEAALTAAGAGPTAVEQLRRGFGGPAFASVRPPGHHALPAQAMGFCLFNNVAVTAARLRDEGERVAIVDWDVHHGNGTQAAFFADGDILYTSVHQSPFYPFQGSVEEVGEAAGEGTTINVPLPAFTAGDVYLEAFHDIVMRAVRAFRPGWVMVSAGFDAHARDPLAELRLTEFDYASMASLLTTVVPADRIVVFLEGGYHLPAIRDSVTAVVNALCGTDSLPPGSEFTSPDACRHALESVKERLASWLGP